MNEHRSDRGLIRFCGLIYQRKLRINNTLSDNISLSISLYFTNRVTRHPGVNYWLLRLCINEWPQMGVSLYKTPIRTQQASMTLSIYPAAPTFQTVLMVLAREPGSVASAPNALTCYMKHICVLPTLVNCFVYKRWKNTTISNSINYILS